MLANFDWVRLLSFALAITAFILFVRLWRRNEDLAPLCLLVLIYLTHGLLYYGVLLLDQFTPTTILNTTAYTNWGAVVRCHSYITWFVAALILSRIHCQVKPV